MSDPNTFRADVDPARAYTGQWALARGHCADDGKIWTIEPRRMAIVQAMRFCAFDEIYFSKDRVSKDGLSKDRLSKDRLSKDGLSKDASAGPTIWSASAKCLAEGRESHDFLFFRVKDNLREMRVTFNDSNSVDLVRCPQKS